MAKQKSPSQPRGAQAVEWRPVSDLMPHARNSKIHEAWQVAQIAASIKAWGFNNPVLVDEQGTIIAGHGRVLAALKLDMPTVPCIVLSHLTENEKRAYLIADNRISENAATDREMLRVELAELGAEGVDLTLLGFSTMDLDDLRGVTDLDDLGNATPPPALEPTTVNSGESGGAHVRMLQMFLDDVSQPVFLARVEKLQKEYGTDTLTDTIVECVRRAAEAL